MSILRVSKALLCDKKEKGRFSLSPRPNHRFGPSRRYGTHRDPYIIPIYS